LPLPDQEFIKIIRDHQSLIYRICYSYCNDAGSRKDLEQEILIALWHSLRKFDGRVKLSTWIYRVALNTAISFYRSGKKTAEHEQPFSEALIAYADQGYDTEQDEQIARLYRFIGELGDFDKALVLLYLDDKKYKEISGILGIPETNVSTRLGRIKEKLRKQFNTGG
jgi:RNA polymerase sigma factor (sigma-70 family)